MNELRAKYLHQVVIIRDGSTSDGMYGLVTQIIEGSKTPLTVTFWAMETMRNDNYYAVEDIELTGEQWSDSLPRDANIRCIYDRNYTKLYYICSRGGRNINGFGTPGGAWADWFKTNANEAEQALHRLVQEATNDPSSCSMESTDESDTTGSGKGDESIAADLEALGERRELSQG